MTVAAVPDHIPSALVYDFDLFGDDPMFADDLHGNIARFAAQGRDIVYTPRNGGHWLVTGRDAVFEAATDAEFFSNSPLHLGSDVVEAILLPINLDPPAHGIYRKILTDAFSPRAMGVIAEQARGLADSMIDEVVEQGRCDFARDVAEPLPVMIFMTLMGFPLDRFQEFRGWVLAGIAEADPAKRQLVWDKVLDMAGGLIRARQAQRQDDLISRLLDADIDGRPPTFDEMQRFCLMLFIAGLDTVTNAMALIVRHLAIDADLQARLRREPKLIPSAIEEITRRYAANTVPRFAARDGDFYGAPIRKGDYVLLFLPTANLDPRAFPDPTRVDLARRAPHLAFGAGPHRCVGAQLARLELKAVLEEWLARVPPFRLDPDQPWRYHTGYVFSIDSLPLLWDAPATGR